MMLPARSRTRRMRLRAFSLLEVLLALAMLLALTGSVYAFLDSVMTQRRRVERAADNQQIAGTVIERIERALFTTLAGSPSVGTGLRGTNTRLTLLTRGVTPPLMDTTTAVPLGDLQVVRFEFDPERRRLSASRRDALDDQSMQTTELISDQVERVRFRYYTGRAWASSFDTREAGTLPAAVEVAIWFRDKDDPDASIEAEAAEIDAFDQVVRSGANSGGEQTAVSLPESVVSMSEPAKPTRQPDRVRVIAIPDASEAGWRGGP